MNAHVMICSRDEHVNIVHVHPIPPGAAFVLHHAGSDAILLLHLRFTHEVRMRSMHGGGNDQVNEMGSL
jgi:hypothetical protein